MENYIFKAFGFLKIIYPEDSPNSILYLVPSLLSILVCCFLLYLNHDSDHIINIFNQPAFDSISTFVQVLPGFYIAALAAIASYNNTNSKSNDNSNLDNKISGNPPYLHEETSNGGRKSELSRRRFLTLMFGYLAAISMLSTVFLFFVRLSYDVGIIFVPYSIYLVAYAILMFIFFFFFFQMILVTLYGIYYLADRMHRP